MKHNFLAALTAAFSVAFLPLLAAGQAGSGFEAGVRAYAERGDARQAIRLIGDELDAGRVSGDDRIRAHVYMAHAFLALGDTVSATPHIRTAIGIHPCVLPAEAFTPPAWVELYERARPPGVSCGRRFASATLRSALVPGWGQYSMGYRGSSARFFASTAAAAAGSSLLAWHGDQRYEAYRTSTAYPDLISYFDQAEVARRRAALLGATAAALYLWNLVDAALLGLEHDRSLSAARPVAISPTLAPGGVGVGLVLHLPLN